MNPLRPALARLAAALALLGIPPAATALTTSDVVIGSASTTGNNGSSPAATINYRILWGYTNDTPGTYSIPVVYTLTSP